MRTFSFARSIFCLFVFVITAACGAYGEDGTAGPAPTNAALRPVEPWQLGFPVPDPEPLLPADADVFNPPLPPSSPSNPAIAEISRTADRGEILSMTGVKLDGETIFNVFSQRPQATEGSVTSTRSMLSDETSATVLLPLSLPAWSMYLIWPQRDGLQGVPMAINRTEAWWVGPEQVTSGSRMSVYGRNLSKANGTGRAYIYIKPVRGAGIFVSPTAVNPFKVDIRVPDLAPGEYEVWAHNSHGGHFGWSGPLGLTILDAKAETRTVIEVKQHGAVGDGVADDTVAVQQALDAAEAAAPAELHFTAGTYRITAGLKAPAKVAWLGEGKNTTEIRLDRTLAGSMIVANGDHLRFQDLALNANSHTGDTLLWLGERQDITLDNVRLVAWGTAALDAKNVVGLSISNSELIENGSFYGSSRQVFLTGNLFRMTGYGESVVALWGGRDFAMVGNTLENADETRDDGHGIGRFFVGQAHFGSLRNLYWQGNVSRNAAPHDCSKVDCNKGEQICFEIVGSKIRDDVVDVSRDTVTFSTLEEAGAREPGGRDLIVVAGRGAGQHRRIVSTSGGTAALEKPWNVVPDKTSRFALASTASRAVIYDNSFDGRDSYSQHDSDSTAVLLYGNVYDVVVDNNRISRMRHGMMTVALDSTVGLSPYFLQYSNNQVSRSSNGLYIGTTFADAGSKGVWGGLGNIYRKNSFVDISHVGVAFDTWDYNGSDYDGTVFEQNSFRNLPYGFVDAYKLMWTHDGRFKTAPAQHSRRLNTILYRNDFDRGSAEFAASRGFVSLHADNTWLNERSTWRNFMAGNAGPTTTGYR